MSHTRQQGSHRTNVGQVTVPMVPSYFPRGTAFILHNSRYELLRTPKTEKLTGLM
jgi:hypothetical protein